MSLRHEGGVCRCGVDGQPVKHGPEGREETLAKLRREKQAEEEAEQEEDE